MVNDGERRDFRRRTIRGGLGALALVFGSVAVGGAASIYGNEWTDTDGWEVGGWEVGSTGTDAYTW